MSFKPSFIYAGTVNEGLSSKVSSDLKALHKFYAQKYNAEKNFPGYTTFSMNIRNYGYYTYTLKAYENAKLLVFAAPKEEI